MNGDMVRRIRESVENVLSTSVGWRARAVPTRVRCLVVSAR